MGIKDHFENGPAGQKAKGDAVKADSDVADKVADNLAKETEQGFRGVEVDPTPNEAYTVQGVTSGAPTPETDDGAAEAARKSQADAQAKATGVGGR